MKVFVTDDHDLIFSAYESLLKSYGHTMVGASKTGQGLIDWLENNTCDIILLDLSMPEMNGIDVLKELFDNEYVPNIIIVSGSYDVKQIQESILLGAKGFILKSEVQNVLGEALEKVNHGRKFFSDTIVDEIILRQLEEDNMITFEDILSDREAQALQLMTENFDTDEICEEMEITKSSFHTLTARMRDKIGVRKNIRLVVLAIKHRFNFR
ncbi:response regulator [Tenacibaculum amylolyticum]|uniref:response regulator n=1 Tax=Tenacibaculum amylolyticum TaxID=104269 RepID=UPI00389541EB